MDNGTGGSTPPPAGGSSTINFDVYSEAWSLFQKQAANWVILTLVYLVIVGVVRGALFFMPFVGSVASAVIGVILQSGMFSAAIKQVRGGTVEINDLFAGLSNLGNVISGGIVAMIAISIGTVLCIIPGIIVAGLLMFVYLLIMDRKVGGIDAITMSYNTLKPQLPTAAVFIFVTGLIMMAGAIALGVGLLVTIPIGLLAISLTYRNVMG